MAPGSADMVPIHPWQHITQILDFRTQGRHHTEYLLCWLHGGLADDTWVPLADISTGLDPFLLQFHSLSAFL
ncbi:hypothetical protein CROQUDRAFT_101192 [Cronartium quercuum f. sp. fusiforme G11]|uniref:Chromo domain-containing protein n=1 Tax=Cronartium quercuum f. sp. fusiforme G11 TaxID=708437 RepID=A0A9P6T5M1_9BASI|nr:hypothetical protein CROQUDRAFT_101192 [Cronartium quercuum f. sp. fusiforme G11]